MENLKYNSHLLLLLSGMLLCYSLSNAHSGNDSMSKIQFTAQMIQRSELRNGYNQPISRDSDPFLFIGQRMRIEGVFSDRFVNIYTSVQDIRIYGSAPNLKMNDNFLSVHEAFAELNLSNKWQTKIGRQELNYDNFRFLGNLDWALPGRAHDILLVKYKDSSKHLHFGMAYNQNREANTLIAYIQPNHYKAAQFIHFYKALSKLKISAMYWNNITEYHRLDSLNNISEKQLKHLHTLGISELKYQIGNLSLSGFYYLQYGINQLNTPINAFDISGQVSYKFNFNSNKTATTITMGSEVLSGNSNLVLPGEKSTVFTPFYGTNHIHNGYMDRFFVGGQNNMGLGLIDHITRLKFDIRKHIFISINYHYFRSYSDYTNPKDGLYKKPYLGSELDFSAGMIFNKSLSLQMGYSHFISGQEINVINEVQNASPLQNWGYIMLIVRPFSNKKFVGLLF